LESALERAEEREMRDEVKRLFLACFFSFLEAEEKRLEKGMANS